MRLAITGSSTFNKHSTLAVRGGGTVRVNCFKFLDLSFKSQECINTGDAQLFFMETFSSFYRAQFILLDFPNKIENLYTLSLGPL